MRRIFVILLFYIKIVGCKKDSTKQLPNCIFAKIIAAEITACRKGATIDAYLFQGKTVYVMNLKGSCVIDASSSVFDENCQIIGQVGGFANINIVNGENFSNSKFIKNVWKK